MKFKSGDRVRVVEGEGRWLLAGSVHTVAGTTDEFVHLEGGDGGGWFARRFEPWPFESRRTIKQLIDDAIAQLEELRHEFSTPGFSAVAAPHPGREFSIAITALEDAQMRTTRGLAMVQGCFKPVDLQAGESR